MARNQSEVEEDIDFLQAMQGVRPLKQVVELVSFPPPKLALHPHKRLKHHHREEHQVEHWWQHSKAPHQAAHLVHSIAKLFYVHPSVSDKRLQQLRQGRFSTRCIIDLHGMNELEASEALTHWLLQCRLYGDKFALIIHGKGIGSDQHEPVLKNLVNWWLRNQSRVLAFCSARECDGGSGAVYVLLKNEH